MIPPNRLHRAAANLKKANEKNSPSDKLNVAVDVLDMMMCLVREVLLQLPLDDPPKGSKESSS